MNIEEITITRKELYEKVWTKPMVSLAKEFGISDRGLAKICTRYDIPRPGLGYWAKLEYGKKVTKKPLYDNPKLDNEKISIHSFYSSTLKKQWQRKQVNIKKSIPITRDISNTKKLHPAVAKAMKTKFKTSFKNNLLLKASRTCFDISVSEANTQRVFILIDTIIKAIENRGHKFTVITEDKELYNDQRYKVKHCFFEIKKEKVKFSITEKLKRVEHKLTPDEKIQKKLYSSCLIPKWDYVPTENMRLIIDTADYKKYCWTETERKKLENRLPLILKGFLKAADSFKKHRIAERIRAIKQADEQRKAWQRELREMEERERISDLLKRINNWNNARLIRQFLKELHNVAIECGRYDENSKFGRWLKWAYSYADKIDPLIKG